MEKNKQISDELLTKYMSGKATPEEEEIVVDYLAENDGNLEDFKNITEAVVLNNRMDAEKPKRNRIIHFATAAAAVALLVMVGWLFLNRSDNQEDNFAQNQPLPQTDSTIVASSSDSANLTEVDNKANKITNEEQIPVFVEPKNYADSSRKIKYASMIYPSRKRTSISNNRKDFNFRWNTDAVEVSLSVESNDGKWAKNQKLTGENHFTLSLPEDVDTLLWQVVFTYADGTTSEQSGMIMRWDTGLKLND